MIDIYKTKIGSSLVALAVGMSGCYGYQGSVLRDVDSVSSLQSSREIFERGFSDFYTTPVDSLEQRVSPFGFMAAGPCPPYLPNCGKKKDEPAKNNEDEGDEVFRGRNPPQRHESSGSSNSPSESPVSDSKKGCGNTCVNIGYVVSGVGLLLLAASLRPFEAANPAIKNSNNSKSEGVAAAGGIALIGGLALVVYGYATKYRTFT